MKGHRNTKSAWIDFHDEGTVFVDWWGDNFRLSAQGPTFSANPYEPVFYGLLTAMPPGTAITGEFGWHGAAVGYLVVILGVFSIAGLVAISQQAWSIFHEHPSHLLVGLLAIAFEIAMILLFMGLILGSVRLFRWMEEGAKCACSSSS